jgi:hypothetical protein
MSESAQVLVVAFVGTAILLSICLGVSFRLRAWKVSVESGKPAEKEPR